MATASPIAKATAKHCTLLRASVQFASRKPQEYANEC